MSPLLLLALSANAADLTVGGHLAAVALNADHELYDPVRGTHLDQPFSIGAGVRLGLGLAPWLDLEGELDACTGPVDGGSPMLVGMRAGPRFIVPVARGFDLHGTVGVGNLAIVSRQDVSGRDVDLALHLGPGLAIDVADHATLRADWRTLWMAHVGESPVPSVQHAFTVGFAWRFGAKVRDGDGDGVPDDVDSCPDARETDNGWIDYDGCPDGFRYVQPEPVVEVAPTPVVAPEPEPEPEPVVEVAPPVGRIEMDEMVQFDTGTANVAPSFREALAGVAAMMTDHPSITHVRIEGHTDSVGADEANLALSQARVDAVVAVLVELGIDPERLSAVGYGETRPVADNATPEGRAANRRVELHVVE